MSLFVVKADNTKVYIDTNGHIYPTDTNTKDEFYCSSCRCLMHYVSQSSNKVTAHFAGTHRNGCDIGFTSSSYNRSNHTFDHKTVSDFLNAVVNDNIKKPSHNVNRQESTSSTHGSFSETTQKTIKPIHTTRQFFDFLAASNPDDAIYDTVKVKDIYCGISTKFLYTKYITGIHLVFCEFHYYRNEVQELVFSYPRNNECLLTISVKIKDSLLYSRLRKVAFENRERPFLIFAEFQDNYCNIVAESQIVPLRNRR